MLAVSVAWSFSGGVAIRRLLPVLWMTSCLHIMTVNMRRRKSRIFRVMAAGFHTAAYDQTDSPQGSSNISERRTGMNVVFWWYLSVNAARAESLCFAVLVEHRLVTDGRTDRQTDRQTQGPGLVSRMHSIAR